MVRSALLLAAAGVAFCATPLVGQVPFGRGPSHHSGPAASSLAHAGSTVPSSSSADEPLRQPFPLAVGTTWVYEGMVWWTPYGARRIYEERVTWEMSVTDTIVRGKVRAGILRGHPSDLAWFERGRLPSSYLLVGIGGERWYLLSGERAARAVRRMRDPEDTLVDLVQDHELILDLPLEPGKRFCESQQITRSDGFYCWVVEDAAPADLRGILGLGDAPGARAGAAGDEREPRQATRYTIALRTLPEHQVWGFVPGVGFTSFAYGHHGAVSAVEVDLVEIRWPAEEDPL